MTIMTPNTTRTLDLHAGSYHLGIWHIQIAPGSMDFRHGGHMLVTNYRPLRRTKARWLSQFLGQHYAEDNLAGLDDRIESSITEPGPLKDADEVEEADREALAVAAETIDSVLNFYPLRCNGRTALEKIKAHPPAWMPDLADYVALKP